MKNSQVFSAVVNLLVIIAIAIYFWRVFSANPDLQTFDDRPMAIKLVEEEWGRLTHGGSRLGNSTAPAVLVEFVDYQCAYCSAVAPMIGRYLSDHRDQSVVIRHFPLSTHPVAESAARAAICAEAQERFERMHNVLYESSDWHSAHVWVALAESIGVPDLIGFEECLVSPETQIRLDADRDLATEFGVRGTPTFISRRSVHEGTLDRLALSRLASQGSAN